MREAEEVTPESVICGSAGRIKTHRDAGLVQDETFTWMSAADQPGGGRRFGARTAQ